MYSKIYASVVLARRDSRLASRDSRLARRVSRLARRETRGGNLLLSGTVSRTLAIEDQVHLYLFCKMLVKNVRTWRGSQSVKQVHPTQCEIANRDASVGVIMACNLPLDLHISLSHERKCYLSQLIVYATL